MLPSDEGKAILPTTGVGSEAGTWRSRTFPAMRARKTVTEPTASPATTAAVRTPLTRIRRRLRLMSSGGTPTGGGTSSARRRRRTGSLSSIWSIFLTSQLGSQRLHPPGHQGADGATSAPEDVTCLGVGEVQVVPEDYGGTLAVREAKERSPERLEHGDVGVSPDRPRLPGLVLKVRPLHLPSPEVHVRQVDDGPAQIGVERVRLPEVREPTCQVDEGILDEVVGQGPVSGQEIRKPDRAISMTQIQIAKPTAPGLLELGRLRHGSRLGSHLLGTKVRERAQLLQA